MLAPCLVGLVVMILAFRKRLGAQADTTQPLSST
jgi:hypothetical protein